MIDKGRLNESEMLLPQSIATQGGCLWIVNAKKERNVVRKGFFLVYDRKIAP